MGRLLIGIGVLVSILTASTATPDYTHSVEAWQKHRVDGLRKTDSWLTLVGLFWLKPGNNTIGSATSNNFVLPPGAAPPHLGTLRLEGSKITYLAPGKTPQVLSYDEDNPDIIQREFVSFFVIKRGNRFAVRAKNSASPVLKNFKGVDFFTINPAFHFQAKFIPDEKKIPILNVLGETEQQESPGLVEFLYKGEKRTLRPLFEGKGEKKTLYFLFKDSTNKTSTYQAGRMLNTPLPVEGRVDLDFNRSYNPPCTFTPYATCPLPPKENILPFAVEAGEKRYGTGHAEYAAR